MSWPAAAWQAPVPATPEMMGVGSYTPEQWATMQQQNWQQWTQWQQQYAQWQTQYGTKYAEQVKSMQDGTQPPLPPPDPSAGACPPPPPDKPPPPPHENNEPLFGATQNTVTPAVIVAPPSLAPQAPAPVSVPFPAHMAQQYYQAPVPGDPSQAAAASWAYNAAAPWGYNTAPHTAQYYQNTSYPPPPSNNPNDTQQVPDMRMANQQQNPNQIDNIGTLKGKPNQTIQSAIDAKENPIDKSQKLSDEEKQFDIQFKKWEEEFDNWKKANVNHPDKQAYREYEKKFETCRVQLVERREQMKIKRIAAAGGTTDDDVPASKDVPRNSTQQITAGSMDTPHNPDLRTQDRRSMQGTIPGDQWRQDDNNMPGNNMARNQWQQDGSNITGNQRQQGGNNMPRDQWRPDKNFQRDQWNQESHNMARNNMPPNNMPPNNMPPNNMSSNNNNRLGNTMARDQWHQDANNMPSNNMERDNWRQRDNISGNNMGRDQWHNEGKNMPGKNQWGRDGNNVPDLPGMRQESNNMQKDDHGNDYNTACDDEFQEDPFAYENDLIDSDDKLKFMSQSDPNKGIPGLDLVDKDDRLPDMDDRYPSSDLTEDPVVRKFQDFTDISKGIDNILGDEKILNILSMVNKGQKPPTSDQWGRSQTNNMSLPPPNNLKQPGGAMSSPNQLMGDKSGPNRLMADIGGPNRQMGDIGGPNRPMGDIGVHNRQMGEIGGPNRLMGDIGGPHMQIGNVGGPNRQQMGDIGGPNRQMSNIGGPNRQMGNIGGPNLQIGNVGGPNRTMGDIGGPNRQMSDIGAPNRQMGNFSGPNRQMGDTDGPNRLMGDTGDPNRQMGIMGGPNRPMGVIGGPNRQMGNIGGPNFINQNNRLDQPKPLMDQRLPNMGPGTMQQSDRFKQQPKPLMDQIITNIGPGNMTPSDGPLLKQPPPFSANNQQNQSRFNNRGPPNVMEMPQPRNSKPDLDSPMGRPGYEDSITKSAMGPNDDYMRDLPTPVVRQPSLEPPQQKTWVDQPIMEPTVVVDYNHKPLRVKNKDFLEPVHTFDYNHISRNRGMFPGDRLAELEIYSQKSGVKVIDYQNKSLNLRNDTNSSVLDPETSFMEREIKPRYVYPRTELVMDRSREQRYPERVREYRERSRERLRDRSRSRERRRDSSRDRDYYSRDRRVRRPRSRERRRTRSRSKETLPKRSGVPSNLRRANARAVDYSKSLAITRTILDAPGRNNRPRNIVIILRGLPGSGKSFVAKLIAEREVANGGVEPAIFSIDDYFTTEMEITEPDPNTGINVQRVIKQYNYDPQEELAFHARLLGDVQKVMVDGSHSFLIVDAVNALNSSYYDIINTAKERGYNAYVIEMDMDTVVCHRRNIHNRSLEDIEILSTRWHPTPNNVTTLDPRALLPSEESVIILSDDDMQIESQSDSNEKDGDSAVFQRRDNNRRSRSRSRERLFDTRDRKFDSKDRKFDTRNRSLDSKDDKSNVPSVDNFSNIVMIDDLLESPGREMRPSKIVIIMRGPPGSGKSYVAKLIKDREVENGGSAPRILSIDDYFIQEVTENVNENGRNVSKQVMKYVYDKSSEATYHDCLLRAFKRTVTEGFFNFIIVDAINEQLKNYAEMWNFAKQHQFHVYISQMEMDAGTCHKRNIHSRSLSDIEDMVSSWYSTPSHHLMLDATTLLQRAAIHEVHMEDVEDVFSEGDMNEDCDDNRDEEVLTQFTSKWDKMDESDKLARLDGTSKPLRSAHCSMEDYLQLDDWQQTTAKPGKKTVRWADIEERRQQEKMRAIGFVVGQTDWHRMTDPTQGGSALTQTKYIERVRKF